MTILLLITLASVIPDVYKSEVSLGSCPKNDPFRMDDGNCRNFTKTCIREENSQCQSVLNACSQCPPSGYTISMLATLNEKLNELSTLRKEIINIKNMSDSSRKQVELLPTLNDKKEILILRKEIEELKNYGKWLLGICVPSFIGIVSIICLLFNPFQRLKSKRSKKERRLYYNTGSENVKIKPVEKKDRGKFQNHGFKEESEPCIKDVSSIETMQKENLKMYNTIKTENEKTTDALNSQCQDIKDINSKLDNISKTLNDQMESIRSSLIPVESVSTQKLNISASSFREQESVNDNIPYRGPENDILLQNENSEEISAKVFHTECSQPIPEQF